MSRRPRREQSASLRRGHSKKEWYVNAAFVAGVLLAIVLFLAVAIQGNELGAGVVGAIAVLVLSVVGIGTYVTLFRDAMYLKEANRWAVPWSYYIVSPILVTMLVYGGASVASIGSALTVGIIGFFVATAGMNTMYLYNRHKKVGTP